MGANWIFASVSSSTDLFVEASFIEVFKWPKSSSTTNSNEKISPLKSRVNSFILVDLTAMIRNRFRRPLRDTQVLLYHH